jgi:hypothetical protein
MAQKFFTPEEANRMLPLVRSIVRNIRESYGNYSEKRNELARLRRRQMFEPKPGGDEEVVRLERELTDLSREMKELMHEISELGVQIKDPVDGIVDFRASIDGDEVFLCWKDGEDAVEHWHGIEEGFAGRKALSPSVRSRA